METIDIKLIFDLEKKSFEVSSNAKKPKEIVTEFLRTQVGAGADNTPPTKQDKYTIFISLDLFEDIFFSVSHDCGNKGLRDGILTAFLKSDL